jgi:hypothetical protein
MAMTKCKECGKDVSDQAVNCPHCGAPQSTAPSTPQKKSGGCLKAVILIGIVVFLGSAFLSVFFGRQETATMTPAEVAAALHGANAPTPAQVALQAAEAERSQRLNAAGACIMLTQRSLNDPSSAEFPLAQDAGVTKTKDGLWKVSFDGRAKNGFGALMRKTFRCTLAFDEKTENWTALQLGE